MDLSPLQTQKNFRNDTDESLSPIKRKRPEDLRKERMVREFGEILKQKTFSTITYKDGPQGSLPHFIKHVE